MFVLVLAAGACKKQESENPAPSAAPAAVASPQATMHTAQPTEVKPEEPAAEEAQATATATVAAPETTGNVQQASAPKAKALASPSPSASAKPSATSTEAAAILKCCSALDAAAQKDNLHKSRYSSASAVCKGLAAQVKSGAANPTSVKTTLRAQLQGVPIPGGC